MNNVDEWSHEFDLLYDNIGSGKAPGLIPYEKSVFLTQAEENIVVALYNGTLGESFESDEEITSYLNSIVSQCEGEELDPNDAAYKKISDDSTVFKLSDDILFITLEKCKIETSCGKRVVPVIPLTQDEYWRTIHNPFKMCNANRVLRLSYSDINESTSYDNGCTIHTLDEKRYSELISKCDILEYVVRYIKRPEPIILEDLPYGLSINGEDKAKTCKLPNVIHRTILAEAVRLAKAVWNS